MERTGVACVGMMVGRLVQLQLTAGQIAIALVGHVGQPVIVIHNYIMSLTKQLQKTSCYQQEMKHINNIIFLLINTEVFLAECQSNLTTQL